MANTPGGAGEVSTHSRLKAAGSRKLPIWLTRQSFNTQPPEGGWAGRKVGVDI